MPSVDPCLGYVEPIELSFKIWCCLTDGHPGLCSLITGERFNPTRKAKRG